MTTRRADQQWDAIVELLGGFDVAMLTTVGRDGALHARPMYLANLSAEGALTFLTHSETGKADEIVSDSRALVTFQSPDRYVAINGHAALSVAPERIEELWRPQWRAFFPRGKEDPALVLIDFIPEHGEYWDDSGRARVRFVWEAIKSYLAGTPIREGVVHGEASPR